jgi:jumonji domain-containing protein 7
MGNERSVSSMHKDHYENLFYVASGEKIFTLCPPADAPFLYERPVPSGRFVVQGDEYRHDHDGERPQPGVWRVRVDGPPLEPQLVPWITADVTSKDDWHAFPLLQYAHPQTVRVQAGELLYLPALWFHRVTQSCETIGINYWYDMNFAGPSWSYFQLMQQLVPTTAVATTTDAFENTNDDDALR